jgi:Domain of unknown function (DUF6456)
MSTKSPSTSSERGFNENESPLYRLYFRKAATGKEAISEAQFVAGEKLRIDYEKAHFERRITASWDPAQTGSSGHAAISDNHIADLTIKALDARRRVHNAFDAVGPELAGVLYYVCCLAGGLEQAERKLQYPQRSGKAVLAMALTRLARHYRLLKTPSKSGASKNIAHWALGDYRPHITPSRPGAHQP